MLRKSVVEVAAEAGLTPSKGEKGEDGPGIGRSLDSVGLTLRDPFKVSFDEFEHAMHLRETSRERDRVKQPLTPEQKQQLLRSMAAGVM